MHNILASTIAALAATALSVGVGAAQEQGSDAELAQKLANPVVSLISVPLQYNYDCCTGVSDARWTLNVQPVLPFALNARWNLIVRTIVPIIDQEGEPDHSGFGDTTQSFFFAPPSKNSLTWAVGPVFYYPTGTDGLSSAKWGAGPTALVLKQTGHVTYGALVNQIWSFAGAGSHPSISTTFLQPFFNYTYPDTTGISVNLESTYDWKHDQWTIPLNVGISHIYAFTGQRVSLGATGRVYLDSPRGGPGWGLRFVATFLFPKH
ncbi:MAG: hypothetical protein ABUS48_01530 [Pseudomonadota bacterium]